MIISCQNSCHSFIRVIRDLQIIVHYVVDQYTFKKHPSQKRLDVNTNSAKLVYFSPTQTTKRVVEGIVQGTQVDQVEHLDLTPPESRTHKFKELRDELAIVGAPVYGGRIPTDAAYRLRRLKGNDTPAVIVVVYGNRSYEDALLELRDLVVEAGFIPVAGGAFLGEHSFSTEAVPIAHGRPDAEDLRKAAEFGELIRANMRDIHALDEIPPLHVPGNLPYKEQMKSSRTSPITLENLCTKCEKCATVCPTAAIVVRDTVATDPDACIWCCACVKNCPTNARVMEHPRIRQSVKWLSKNCAERQEPEIYV
jgi:ferredoxin